MGLCVTGPSWTVFEHIWFCNEKCAVRVLQILLAIVDDVRRLEFLQAMDISGPILVAVQSKVLVCCRLIAGVVFESLWDINAWCVCCVSTSWWLDHRSITVCVCVCVCVRERERERQREREIVCDLATSTVNRSRSELACSATKNGGTVGTRCMQKNEFLCRVLFSLRKLALITSPVGHLEVIPGGCSEVPHKETFTLFLLLFFCIFILSSLFPSY